jgi:SpoVK/Ycf46/Vps4 family AAA+-type ATPase
LWSTIKNVCFNPDFYEKNGQCGKISLLLCGPPGTGKSTFAYRVAMCLHRHIISLDLREQSKHSIYQILQKPSEDYCTSYRDAIFLFEEFDISIKELSLRDKKRKNEMMDFFKQMEKYIRFTEQKNVSDDPNKNDLKQPSLNIHNNFTMRDLLEIFQGPVPFDGMIILATTNNFDEIYETCPELFRHGRLTPIHIGYIDKDTLQEISQFYFKRKLKYVSEHITIPTSQIIDLALEALLYSKNNSFNYLESQLKKLLQ